MGGKNKELESLAEFAVEGAEEGIEGIARGGGEVVGAGIGALGASESFLEGGETGPRMVGAGVGGGDAPEIESCEAFGSGVEDELEGENASGVKMLAGRGLGALEIVASGGVIENEAGGENFGRLFYEVERRERLDRKSVV